MSSSKRTPFQDITNGKNLDPREVKRQRDREYYAKNKYDISKHRRQARQLKKQASSMAPLNEDTTPAAGQSGVTQLQYKTTLEGMAPVVQQTYASQLPQADLSQFYAAGSFNHIAGVEATVGCTNVSLNQPVTSTSRSDECALVKDLSNNRTHQIRQCKEKQSGQSWYARLSDERKKEYIQRQSITRQQKNAATPSSVNSTEVPQGQHTPLCNEIISHANVLYLDESPDGICTCKPREDTPGTRNIGSAYCFIHKDLTTRCNEPMLDEDDSDWLHSNLTCIPHVRSVERLQNMSKSAGGHGQKSFAEKSAYSEKKQQRDNSEQKRQRERERYSSMTDEQKEACLHNNHEYKKLVWEHNSPLINSRCTPDMQTQPSKIYQIGNTNRDEDSDTTGIFEPDEQGATFEDNLDTIQEEQPIDDDDEKCRIFSGTCDVFDSYRVTSGVAPSNQNDDPYDYVYHNLPSKHHVLKPVQDYIHCGAMKLQYEGPAFCCRKGKVKIVTPEVPQELRRLFTSQVDEDAKYFRKHI